jgi:hypothetical protein
MVHKTHKEASGTSKKHERSRKKKKPSSQSTWLGSGFAISLAAPKFEKVSDCFWDF